MKKKLEQQDEAPPIYMQESNFFALNGLSNQRSIADEMPLELGRRTRSKSASGSLMMQIDNESDS